MRIVFVLAFLLASSPVIGQLRQEDDFERLIARLGSTNVRVREAAMESLKKEPKSEAALREALRSPDAEIARRAAVVLDFHANRPVRELAAAAKEGRVSDLIELLAQWPNGKFEAEAWAGVRNLLRTVVERHHDENGRKYGAPWLRDSVPVQVITETTVKDIRDNFGVENFKDPSLDFFFVRCRKVDLSLPDKKPRSAGYHPGGGVYAASVSARFGSLPHVPLAVLAGGNVDVGGHTARSIIISGGDVNVSGSTLWDSIIIARGKVTCTGVRMADNRIISGKSVAYDKKDPPRNLITENEPNPLGFIRWADPPKDKSAPKAK